MFVGSGSAVSSKGSAMRIDVHAKQPGMPSGLSQHALVLSDCAAVVGHITVGTEARR